MRIFLLVFVLLTVSFFPLFAQKTIDYPVKLNYKTANYIRTAVPTNENQQEGLWLPQGFIQKTSLDSIPVFIPSNKPTWAIAIAVAWNMERNLIGRVNYPKISSYLGTAALATELSCVTGLTWSSTGEIPTDYSVNSYYTMKSKGCFQLEGPGSYYAQLSSNYPNRFKPGNYDTICTGLNGFETSVLAKAYSNLASIHTFDQFIGWDLLKSIDCTDDVLAYEKTTASVYNGGPYAFHNNASSFYNGSNNGNSCWSGLPATSSNYLNNIAKFTADLEGLNSHCDFAGTTTPPIYYNNEISLQNILDYLEIIKIVYPELDLIGIVNPAISKVFNEYKNSNNKISFTLLGPVIDEIIFQLPKEFPIPVDNVPSQLSSINSKSNALPYAEIKKNHGNDSICLGESISLEIRLYSVRDSAVTYKWFDTKDTSIILSTEKKLNYTSTAIGNIMIGAQVCNDNGCFTLYCNSKNTCTDSRVVCGYPIYVSDCANSCTFSVSEIKKEAAICSGNEFTGAVTIKFDKGVIYDASLTSFNTSGSSTQSFSSFSEKDSIVLNRLQGGLYNLKISDKNNPSCILQTSFNIDGQQYKDSLSCKVLDSISCAMNVKAEIIALNKTCKVKIRVYNKIYGQWEPLVLVKIENTNGSSYFGPANKKSPTGGIQQYYPVDLVETWFKLSPTDSLIISATLPSIPGANQYRPYQVFIMDENNNVLQEFLIEAGSTFSGIENKIGTYKADCTNSLEEYTFNWSPSLSSWSTTSRSVEGNTEILTQNQTDFIITATPKATNSCILQKQLIVNANDLCLVSTVTKINDLVELLPNPAHSYVTIATDLTGVVQLININGQVIKEILKTTHSLQMEIGNIPNGFYSINVIGKSNRVSSKLVIQH